MNSWFEHPRSKDGQRRAFEAELAERRGEFAGARKLYEEAAEAFETVALTVPATHPNTRADLAIAAVASYARAGDLGHAVEVARRVLVEPDAISEHGRAELVEMLRQYDGLIALAVSSPIPGASTRKRTLRAGERSTVVRDDVKSRFRSQIGGVA